MKKLTLILLLALLIVPRLLFLNSVPYSASHDEVEYAVNSLSYAVRGTDTSGVSFPRSLFVTFTEGVISPIPTLLLAPWYFVFGISEWSMNVPYVLVNILTAWLFYLLAVKLSGKQEVGWATAFFFLVSPWGFFYSRYSVDSPFALLFGLIGIYAFLNAKKNRVLIVALAFVAMFYSYHAAKLLYVPLIVILAGWHHFFAEQKYLKKEYILHVTIALLVFGSYYIISLLLPDSMIKVRESHTLIFTSDEISTSARIMRERSLALTPINQLLINNVTVGLSVMAGKYLQAFSPDVLLVSGDMRAAYRFYEYGLLYVIQGVFIVYGLLRLYAKRRALWWLVICLLLLAPLPTAMSTVETSVMHRSFLMLVGLSFIGGYGMCEIVALFHRYQVRNEQSHLGRFLVYGISLLWFGFFVHFYFMSYGFRYPDSVFTFNKTVAHYARLMIDRHDRELVIVAPEQRSVFFSMLAFMPRETQINTLRALPSSRFDTEEAFRFDRVTVTRTCPSVDEDTVTYVVRHDVGTCGFADEGIAIKDPRDAAPIWRIRYDGLCEGVDLQQWRSPSYLSDFRYDSMDVQTFCKRWVSDRT